VNIEEDEEVEHVLIFKDYHQTIPVEEGIEFKGSRH